MTKCGFNWTMFVTVVGGVFVGMCLQPYWDHEGGYQYGLTDTTRAVVTAIGRAIELYYAKHHVVPLTTDELLSSPDVESASVKKCPVRHGFFLDMWQRDIEYVIESTNLVVRSGGSNGVMGDEDDIVFKSTLVIEQTNQDAKVSYQEEGNAIAGYRK